MTRDVLNRKYFEWLNDIVYDREYAEYVSYNKLLTYLHNIEFKYLIPMDQNRAEDGVDLRWRFSCERKHDIFYGDIEGPCSVLEMMVALAIRCEEGIMDDPAIGDRTGQWFWGMIVSMGLGGMHDYRFNQKYVEDTVERFLNRDYEPNGKGGLFTIRRHDEDLRDMEILHQLYAYLNSII